MTVQFSNYALDYYVAPEISAFDQADIPDLRERYDQHSYWLSNHFLNSLLRGAFATPFRQYAINAVYRVQTTFGEYHEARGLTYTYLELCTPGRPAIRAYFVALSRWESCFLNWQILVDIFRTMTNAKVFEPGDGSPDQRAYDIGNKIKHGAQAAIQAEYGAAITVPMWLSNTGFSTHKWSLSYTELGTLMAQAADLANDMQDPRSFVERRGIDQSAVPECDRSTNSS
jgi:hypothetical protein